MWSHDISLSIRYSTPDQVTIEMLFFQYLLVKKNALSGTVVTVFFSEEIRLDISCVYSCVWQDFFLGEEKKGERKSLE